MLIHGDVAIGRGALVVTVEAVLLQERAERYVVSTVHFHRNDPVQTNFQIAFILFENLYYIYLNIVIL